MLELLLEVIASGFGGVGNKPRQPFPEGEMNASLGAVAAFTGALSFIFALSLFAITLFGSGLSVGDYASLIAASFAVALLASGGRRAGIRAHNVTRRNL